jgi:hypothetical protein
MSDTSRTVIAAVVAPLAPALLFVAFSPDAALIAGIFSYIVFFLFGLPAISVLRRVGKLNFPSLILAGAIIGAGSFLCFNVGLVKLLGSPASSALDLTTYAWGAGLGALVAGTFGAIAGLHNLRANRAAQNA